MTRLAKGAITIYDVWDGETGPQGDTGDSTFTYYQTADPRQTGNPQPNELWYSTTTLLLKRFNDLGGWDVVSSNGMTTEQLTDFGDLQDQADNKISIFVQETTPTWTDANENHVDDQWYTPSALTWQKWSGTAWVDNDMTSLPGIKSLAEGKTEIHYIEDPIGPAANLGVDGDYCVNSYDGTLSTWKKDTGAWFQLSSYEDGATVGMDPDEIVDYEILKNDANAAIISVNEMEDGGEFSVAEKIQWRIMWPGMEANFTEIYTRCGELGYAYTALGSARDALYSFLNGATHAVFTDPLVSSAFATADELEGLVTTFYDEMLKAQQGIAALQSPSLPTDENLVAYFGCNGDMTDNSGKVNTGYWESSTHTWESGVTGLAVKLDGASIDRFTLNTPIELTSAEGYSISYWFREDSTHNCPIGDLVNGQHYVYHQANYITIMMASGKSFTAAVPTASRQDGKMHHIVITVSDTLGAIYFDGTYVGGADLTSSFFDNIGSKDFDIQAIGAGIANTFYHWHGLLDEIRIYNKTLSNQEALALYYYPSGNESAYIDPAGVINRNEVTMDGGKLTADTVTADKINVTTLSAITANLGTITTGSLNVLAGGVTTYLGNYSSSHYGLLFDSADDGWFTIGGHKYLRINTTGGNQKGTEDGLSFDTTGNGLRVFGDIIATDNVKANHITELAAVETASIYATSYSEVTAITTPSITIEHNSPIMVQLRVDRTLVDMERQVWFRLYRNTTLLKTWYYFTNTNTYDYIDIVHFKVDTPGNGTHTYKLTGQDGWQGGVSVAAGGITLSAFVTKR